MSNDPDQKHHYRCDTLWYQCPTCSILVYNNELNFCETDLQFIPIAQECVCEELKEEHIQY